MDKLQEILNNIDNIIDNIKKNTFLQKTSETENLENIIKLDKQKKLDLEEKIESINKFSNLLDNIITNKPNPNSLDEKLVDYIGYNEYYKNIDINKKFR